MENKRKTQIPGTMCVFLTSKNIVIISSIFHQKLPNFVQWLNVGHDAAVISVRTGRGCNGLSLDDMTWSFSCGGERQFLRIYTSTKELPQQVCNWLPCQ